MARGGAHKHLALENRSAGSAAAVDAVVAFVVVLMRAQLLLLSLSFAPSHPRSFAVAVVATPTRTAAATATAITAATAFHFRHVANFVFMQQISISCYKIARFALVLVDQRACVCVCVFLALCQFATSFSFFFRCRGLLLRLFFRSLRKLMLKVSVLAKIALYLHVFLCLAYQTWSHRNFREFSVSLANKKFGKLK